MNAPLGLMPAAVRCQPYPFAGITQVRFLRSPRPVGASQPGLPRSNRSAPSSRSPIQFKARVAPAGEAVNRLRTAVMAPRLPNLNPAFVIKRLTRYRPGHTLESGKRWNPPTADDEGAAVRQAPIDFGAFSISAPFYAPTSGGSC